MSQRAALIGAWGMQAVISGTAPMYVGGTLPVAQASYHARFYFAPNGLTLASGSTQDIFVGRSAAPVQTLFRVQIRRSGTAYAVRGIARETNGVTPATNWYNLSNASHAIELSWNAATTPGGTDGAFGLWRDGKLLQTVSGITNDPYRLAEVRLGPASGVSAGTSGTEYFDAYVSTRSTYIGP